MTILTFTYFCSGLFDYLFKFVCEILSFRLFTLNCLVRSLLSSYLNFSFVNPFFLFISVCTHVLFACTLFLCVPRFGFRHTHSRYVFRYTLFLPMCTILILRIFDYLRLCLFFYLRLYVCPCLLCKAKSKKKPEEALSSGKV